MKHFKSTSIFLCLLLIHQFLFAHGHQENYYKPENILRFAEHLFQEGDYLRAASEFLRYLYYSDSIPTHRDSVYYKIGLCYRLGEDYQKSVNYFQKVIDDYPYSDYLDDSHFQIAYSHFLSGKYEESLSFAAESLSQIKREAGRLKLQQLTGLNYIYQKQWRLAVDHLSSLENRAKLNALSASLLHFAKQGEQLPRKSKFLAGLMSAIVPGTGKMYCHRTGDGLVSLLTIGLTGWQAYDGFHEKGIKSVKGWIFGTITTFFYLGNIYGSVVAVNVYNQQLEDKLLREVGVTIHVSFK
jgi:tetratricopeptide (TPR) repeat protein